MKKDVTKLNIVWNTIGALAVSFTSLVYMLILTHLYDLNKVGVFSFGFSFACMMVTLASFGGRTYQVTDTNNKFDQITYIVTRYLTVIFSLLIVGIYLIVKDYNIEKTIMIVLLVLFKFCEEISDVYYGVLQRQEQLYKVGIFQTIKSVLNVIIFFVINYFVKNITISVSALLIINAVFAFIIERNSAKKIEKWKYKFEFDKIKYVLYNNFYICMFMFLSSYIISSPKYAIDSFLSEDIQAIFNILIMPATFVYLVGSFILNPFLVKVAKSFNQHKYQESKKQIKNIIMALLAISVVIMLGAYILGIPVLNFVYGLNLSNYKMDFMIIMIGAIFYSISTVISTVLVAYRKIKIQSIIAIFLSIIAYILSRYLVNKYGLLGGIYEYTILMFIRFAVYSILIFSFFKNLTRKESK